MDGSFLPKVTLLGLQAVIESYYEDQGVIYYVVDLAYEQTAWKVRLRFRQFDALYNALAQKVWEAPLLPGKTLWRKKDPAWLDGRKAALEQFVAAVLSRTDTLNSEEARYVFAIDQHLPDKILHTPVLLHTSSMNYNVVDCIQFTGGYFFGMAETNLLGKIDSWITNIRLPWEKEQGNVQPNGVVSYCRRAQSEFELATIWSITFPEGVTCLHWSDEDGVLSIGREDGAITLLQIAEPYTRYAITQQIKLEGGSRIVGLAFDAPYLYSIDANKKFYTFQLSGEEAMVEANIPATPQAVVWNLQQKRAIVGLANGSVAIYDLSTLPTSQLGSIDSSSNSPIVATQVDFEKGLMFVGHKDGSINVIDREQGARPSNLVQRLQTKPDITSLAVNPTTDEFFVGHASGTVSVWTMQSVRPIYVLAAHSRAISCLRYIPPSRVLITGSSDKTYRIYQLPQIWTGEITDVPTEVLTADTEDIDAK